MRAACYLAAAFFGIELSARNLLEGCPDGFVGVWRDSAQARAKGRFLDKLIERRRAGIIDPPWMAFASASVWNLRR